MVGSWSQWPPTALGRPIMPLELLAPDPAGPAGGGLLWPAGVGGGLVFLPNPAAAGAFSPHQALATSKPLAIVPNHAWGAPVLPPAAGGRLPLRSGACVGLSVWPAG